MRVIVRRELAASVTGLVLAFAAGCSGYSPYDARPCRSGQLKANAMTDLGSAFDQIDSQLMQVDQVGGDFGIDRSALERQRGILEKRVDVDDILGCAEISGAVDVRETQGLLTLLGVERIGRDWQAVHDREAGDNARDISTDPDPRILGTQVWGGNSIRQGSLTVSALVDSLAPLRRLRDVRVLDLTPSFAAGEVGELEELEDATDLPGAEMVPLESLEGLEALRAVDELRLIGLRKVSSLAPLAGLTSPLSVLELVDLDGVTAWDGPTVPVRSLTVQAMSQLEDLGVPVQADETTPSGAWLVSWNEVRIRANPRLARLSGLRSLRSIRTLELRALPALQDLSDLAGLERATTLTLRGLGIREVTSLAALRSVSSLELQNLPNLTEVSALHGLDSNSVQVRDVPRLPGCAIEALIDAVRPERAKVWGPFTVDACTPSLLSRFGPSERSYPDFMPPLFDGVDRLEAADQTGSEWNVRWNRAFDDSDVFEGRIGVARYLVWIAEQPLDPASLGPPTGTVNLGTVHSDLPPEHPNHTTYTWSAGLSPGQSKTVWLHVQAEDGAGKRDGNTVVRTATISRP
jgi:hypothetical protein